MINTFQAYKFLHLCLMEYGPNRKAYDGAQSKQLTTTGLPKDKKLVVKKARADEESRDRYILDDVEYLLPDKYASNRIWLGWDDSGLTIQKHWRLGNNIITVIVNFTFWLQHQILWLIIWLWKIELIRFIVHSIQYKMIFNYDNLWLYHIWFLINHENHFE